METYNIHVLLDFLLEISFVEFETDWEIWGGNLNCIVSFKDTFSTEEDVGW